MFKLFKKKPEPFIHHDLYKNAIKAIDELFKDMLNDDAKMRKLYLFHYGEAPATELHATFAATLVHNLYNRVSLELPTKFKEKHDTFTSTLEFCYTPYLETGAVLVELKIATLLLWKATEHHHKDWTTYEEANPQT